MSLFSRQLRVTSHLTGGAPWRPREEEMAMGRRYFQGGWAIRAERDYDVLTALGSLSMGRQRYTLDGLQVTVEEAQAIIASRPYGGGVSVRHDYGMGYGSGLVTLDGIELTGDEAQMIGRGAHPLAVLLPRLMVRALTAEEMLAG